MMHPLAPFAMRGAIWYQGESNGGEGESYYHKTKALVNGWRQLFNPDLSFYWVQLANFQQPNDNPAGGDGWAAGPRSTAQGTDDPAHRHGRDHRHRRGRRHPPAQQTGRRLRVWPNGRLHQTYGEKDLVPCGPLLQELQGRRQRDPHFVRPRRRRPDGRPKEGLEPTQEVAGGKLKRFAIAGADKVWHWADATIDGNTVVVKSSERGQPGGRALRLLDEPRRREPLQQGRLPRLAVPHGRLVTED